MKTSMLEINRMLDEKYNVIKPNFRAGDTVAAYITIKNKGKEIEKPIQGVCIRVTQSGFLLRSTGNEAAIEYNFSRFMPNKTEVIEYGKVRQGRIYYLRDLQGKKAKIKKDFNRSHFKVKEPARVVAV